MLEVSKIIFQLLSGVQLLITKNVAVQPVISNQDAELPLVNYAMSETSTYSKEGKLEYVISVRVYATNYDEALEIIDAIYAAVKASTYQFKYNGTTEPQADAYGQYYTESNYSFKNK